MELRDFAEQVLFTTTLEEKLRAPSGITDDYPGTRLDTPAVPGRPDALHFKPLGSAKSDVPGLHRLEDEHERGKLLHFFANHELLATELMALVLLKFPEAPAAFRSGVLQTLKDEQEHTRWYMKRMGQCGIQFGDIPVSGYFWRAISGMENPMDYVAGLSLTFEQANLDFAQHFSTAFATVGDADSAKLLGKIYRDEIGHVAYGLKWFRRWKNPVESDWEAFCHQLKFPLSPSRAKGFSLNIEGRKAAGLEISFIDELNVHAQSKGRTPNVFVFNPFAEGYIAHGKKFTPVKQQAELARDLDNLPQYLGRQDDVVIVHERPTVHFLSGLKQAGFALPEFVTRNQMHALASRNLGRLRPWAWGPDSVQFLGPLFAQVTGEERTAEQRFNRNVAQFYSKAWSADFLKRVLSEFEEPWCCSADEIGVKAETMQEVLAAIGRIRQRGHHKVNIKEALGLAGHNAIRLWEPELLDTQRRWLAHAIENGRPLVVEPWLDREIDFSVQLEMTAGGLELRGYTGLINDRRGQFQANWAAPNYLRRIPDAVTVLFREPRDIAARLHGFYGKVFSKLEEELRRNDYLGPLGIDAFVYRSSDETCRLKPIVEINPRYTMGRLTVELMQRTAPGSFGLFRIVSRATARKEGLDDFPAYARMLSKRFPLRMEGEPVPKIFEGGLCLNDPSQAQSYLALFQVSRTLNLQSFGGGPIR